VEYENITVRRNGALGDVIASLNALSKLKEKYNKVTYVTSQEIIDNIGFLISNYCDELKTESDLSEEESHSLIDFLGYTPPFPEKVTSSLIENFCKEVNVDYNLNLPAIDSLPNPFVDKAEEDKIITIQKNAGWSVYKEYNNFNKVIEILKAYDKNFKFYQIGGPDEDLLNNLEGSFIGKSFKENLSAQSHSDLHIGVDSVFNNTSNISWSHRDKTRSLILFLSSSERLTAYPHNLNVFKELECRPCFRDNPDRSYGSLGPKTPCDNPPNQSYENPIHECGNIDPMYISNIVRQVI